MAGGVKQLLRFPRLPLTPALAAQQQEVPTPIFPHTESTDALARAFLTLETMEDCYRLFEDLFTIKEVQELSQRLEVARMLSSGSTYTEVVEKTGVSTATIGKVNQALNYGAGGYHLVLGRMAQSK